MTFMTHFNFILKPFGFTDIQVSSIFVIFMIFGIVGTVITIIYLRKTSNYRKIFRVLLIGDSLVFVLMIIEINLLTSVFVTTFLAACLGLFGIPIAFVCYKIGE